VRFSYRKDKTINLSDEGEALFFMIIKDLMKIPSSMMMSFSAILSQRESALLSRVYI